MSEVSVRFYVGSKASKEQVQAVAELKKDGRHIARAKEQYFEFKVENHLMNFPEEFISEEFCQAIRPIIDRITLLTKAYHLESPDSTFTIGSTKLSCDIYSIMIKGKNLSCMIKMFNIFHKYKGKMGKYSEDAKRRKAAEIELYELRSTRLFYENSYKNGEKLIQNLKAEIETLKQERQNDTEKESSPVKKPAKWQFWLWEWKLS